MPCGKSENSTCHVAKLGVPCLTIRRAAFDDSACRVSVHGTRCSIQLSIRLLTSSRFDLN